MFIPLNDANSLKHIRLQFVTLAIIAANVLIWLFFNTPTMVTQEAQIATAYSYGFIPAVVNGYETLPPELVVVPEYATYLTYAFFHSNFMHLAGNMLFIWVFGDNVEDAMGHFRYGLFYLACAAAGAFLHQSLAPASTSPLIGASGAVAGIVGAYIILHPKIRVWILALGRIPLRIPAMFVLGAWILFQFFQLLTDTESQVSWAAHVGGVIAGIALIFPMRRKGVALFDRDADIVVPTPGALAPHSAKQTAAWRKGPFDSSQKEQIKAKPIQWGRGKDVPDE